MRQAHFFNRSLVQVVNSSCAIKKYLDLCPTLFCSMFLFQVWIKLQERHRIANIHTFNFDKIFSTAIPKDTHGLLTEKSIHLFMYCMLEQLLSKQWHKNEGHRVYSFCCILTRIWDFDFSKGFFFFFVNGAKCGRTIGSVEERGDEFIQRLLSYWTES